MQVLAETNHATGGTTRKPRLNLQRRVRELLSNTAAARALPTPVSRLDDTACERARAFLAAHPDIIPVDPWLPVLRAQKID